MSVVGSGELIEGIGGDAFCLYYDAKSKKVGSINGSGRAPKALTLEYLRKQGVTGDTVSHLSLVVQMRRLTRPSPPALPSLHSHLYIPPRPLTPANTKQIPLTNLNSVTCPGTAAGWCKTIETYGSGMSMADILAPAIRMAKEGVPVHELNAEAWKIQEQHVKNASPAWKE